MKIYFYLIRKNNIKITEEEKNKIAIINEERLESFTINNLVLSANKIYFIFLHLLPGAKREENNAQL